MRTYTTWIAASLVAFSLLSLPAADRAFAQTGGAKPEEIQGMIDKLEKSFTSFREVEGKLWSEVK